MLTTTQFALRKAIAVSRSLPAPVNAALLHVQECITKVENAPGGSTIADDIRCLESSDNAFVVVAGVQAAAYFCSTGSLDSDAAGDLLCGLVRRGLASPDAAVRNAAVGAVAIVLVASGYEPGARFLELSRSGCTDASLDWQVNEAFVMALCAVLQSREACAMFHALLQHCVFDALSGSSAVANKYVSSAFMHLCSSVVEAFELDGDSVLLVSKAIVDVMSGGSREARFSASLALRSVVKRWPRMLLLGPPCAPLFPCLVLSRYYGPERHRLFCVSTWKRFVDYAASVVVLPSRSDHTAATSTTLFPPAPSSMFATITTRSSDEPVRSGAVHSRGRTSAPGPSLESPTVQAKISDRAVSPSRRKSLSAAVLDSQFLAEEAPSAGSDASSWPQSKDSSDLSSPPVSISTPDEYVRGISATVGSVGPALVAQRIAAVSAFYLSQLIESADADAREAAAHCIAELVTKVDLSVVRPYAESFLGPLLSLCGDTASWACRDAAAVASSKLVCAFSDVFSKTSIDGAVRVLFLCLSDEHRMVRDHAAMSIISLSRNFSWVMADAISMVEIFILNKGAPSGSGEFAGTSAPEWNQDLNWRRVAGVACFIRELAGIEGKAEAVARVFAQIIDSMTLPECPLWACEVFCRAIPETCSGIGKKATKRLLDALLILLHKIASQSSEPLGHSNDPAVLLAVGDVSSFLRVFVGPSIFDGHVTPAQAEALMRAASIAKLQ